MKKLALTQYSLFDDTQSLVPALLGDIPAGVGLELASEIEQVNLHKLLLQDCPDAMLCRAQGTSMVNEVDDGDWILVSRSLQPDPGDIVVASVNGEQTLKYFKLNDQRGNRGLFLVSNNAEFPTRELTYADDVVVLAVVVKIIKDKRSALCRQKRA